MLFFQSLSAYIRMSTVQGRENETMWMVDKGSAIMEIK